MGGLYQRCETFYLGFITGAETRVQQKGRDARTDARKTKCEANESGQRNSFTNRPS